MKVPDEKAVGVAEPELTTAEFWDEFWRPRKQAGNEPRLLGRVKAAIRTLIGENTIELIRRPYWDYVLWERLYRRFLPPLAGAKVLEIGSAPGQYLVRLHKVFGCDPFGVEYSPAGFDMNRKTFMSHGLDPANVIFADAFSTGFQSKYRGAFDVVISRGVIEHFTDVEPILHKHYALVKGGGHLVVSVPNFRGLPYVLARIFDRESLRSHNLKIMRKRQFSNVFRTLDLRPVFCGHYGVCDLSVPISGPMAKRGAGYTAAYHVIDKAQGVLNAVFRISLRGGGLDSGWFSPFLLCIARRPVPADSGSR